MSLNKIALNGLLYDVIIIDNDIVLQNLAHDIEFKDAYLTLKDEAEDEFFSVEFAGQSLKSFISDYIERRIETFILFNKELGQKVEHNLN